MTWYTMKIDGWLMRPTSRSKAKKKEEVSTLYMKILINVLMERVWRPWRSSKALQLLQGYKLLLIEGERQDTFNVSEVAILDIANKEEAFTKIEEDHEVSTDIYIHILFQSDFVCSSKSLPQISVPGFCTSLDILR